MPKDVRPFLFLLLSLSSSALAINCGAMATDEDGDLPLPPRRLPDGALAPDDASDAGGQSLTDAPSDTSFTPDDGPVTPPPPCDLLKPFGTPVAITELNSAKEDYVVDVAPDELTIYVGTNNNAPQGVQLFSATRATKTSAWGPLTQLFPFGAWDNWSVAVSGNTAIVSSDRSGNSELYIATRANAQSPFGSLTLTTGASSAGNEEGPRFASGNTFYFDSTRNGSRDIFVATLNGGAFSNVAPVATLNTAGLDGVPVLTSDELTMYFLSNRPPAKGEGDIFMATRASKTAAFGNITQVPNVNSDGLDVVGHVSMDGCTLYITSTRFGTGDIFVAKRPN